jgi:uncharacterized protein YndB with AHSA1/START domain
MKYTTEITINLPRERVVSLMDDPANLKKWQPTLQTFEHIEGEPGTVGAKTKLVYNEKGRKMEMVETITSHNLPDELAMKFEASGVHNVSESHFYDAGDKTKWIMENEFQFSGFMVLIGLFMRGAFPKETRASMQRFKDFAESV